MLDSPSDVSNSTSNSQIKENVVQDYENNGNPCPSLPNIDDSQAGGETLQNHPNRETLVYTRRRLHHKSKNPPVTLGQDQSDPSSNGSLNIPGTSLPFPSPIELSAPINPSTKIIESQKNNFTDLHIPIAVRKGTQTCTKHPIAQYLSYKKLSHSHRAFTSKISHLFVPRNIQEALDNPDWKLAVMEEMNALRRSGT